MNKFDVYSLDNINQISGYAKIGSFPLQPGELNNYNFPTNNNNMELEVFWTGAGGYGKYAKFNVALRDSNRLIINLLSKHIKGDLPTNPIAYIRTQNSFDLYVKNFTDINMYLNIKCKITQTKEPRFIPESGNPIIDISELNPTYFNPDLLEFTNSSLNNFRNNAFYQGKSSNASIDLPKGNGFLCKIFNVNSSTLNEIIVYISGKNIVVKKKDESNLNATLSDNKINLTGLEYYSWVYYELSTF